MPEKISDIYYPKLNQPLEPESVKSDLESPRKKISKRRKFFPLIFLGIILFLGIFFAVFSLSQAQIEIWPETQILTFKEKVEVNTKTERADFEKKVFPGEIFELELEKSKEFTASGKSLQGEKAKGVIQVYNTYSTESQVLIANTRFISAEGKLFRSLKRVVIPGGKYDEKGKLTPGFLDIEVAAAEAGEEYNIGPSTFSIPGFAGTPKYTSFYGKSFSDMQGGFQGEIPQVTQEDLRKAEDAILDNLLEEGEKNLKNQIEGDFVLLQDAFRAENIEFLPGVKAGENLSSFNSQIKGNFKAIIFKHSDLEKFTKTLILNRIPENEILPLESFWMEVKIQEESLKSDDYKIYSIDWERGLIVLDLEVSAKAYPVPQEALVKRVLVGKSVKEAEILLSNQPQVKKAEVKLRPFWLKRIPQKADKIKLKLTID